MSPHPAELTPSEITAVKKDMRARARARRAARAAEDDSTARRSRDADLIAEAVLDAPGLPGRGDWSGLVVASYLDMPTEPATDAMHRALTGRGARVIVPVLLPDMDLDWTDARYGRPGSREDPEQPTPRHGVDAVGSADLVIVPALLVDEQGWRLGQGGGCYDRALRRRPAHALVAALVDDDALVPWVPHTVHDRPVDAVIRPTSGWTHLPAGSSDLRK
ncbi:5-formyltetrahydrofolate cyclo-ligase [Austwickia chelonae]|nr:5-formyltetrahydrofolate cyclo-ligase [Austwickia chelonae]